MALYAASGSLLRKTGAPLSPVVWQLPHSAAIAGKTLLTNIDFASVPPPLVGLPLPVVPPVASPAPSPSPSSSSPGFSTKVPGCCVHAATLTDPRQAATSPIAPARREVGKQRSEAFMIRLPSCCGAT